MYSNLAAKSVTFTKEAGGSVTVAGRDLDELKVAVQPADAPVRLILPYSVRTEGREGQFYSLDSINGMRWYIADLMLWKPVPLGRYADIAPDIVRYQAAYLDMLRTFKDFGIAGAGGSTAELVGNDPRPGIYKWPADASNDDAGAQWHGVMWVLQVLEINTGIDW
jgi:hypothetical protein